MRICNCLAAIEFLHDEIEGGVTEPLVSIAREQGDSIRLQYIERVLDLAKASFRIGEGYGCKHTKAPRIMLSQRGCIIIAVTRKATPLCLVSKPNPGRAHRRDRC